MLGARHIAYFRVLGVQFVGGIGAARDLRLRRRPLRLARLLDRSLSGCHCRRANAAGYRRESRWQ